MKRISQQMLSDELRKPFLRERKKLLYGQLRDPRLSVEARKRIERELWRVGKPKEYSSEENRVPGSIVSPKVERIEIQCDFDRLLAEPHFRLYRYALQEDLDVRPTFTKMQIIQRILARNEP